MSVSLYWCYECDEVCYEAKSKYEEQRRITMEQEAIIKQQEKQAEFEQQKALMETPWYKEKLRLEVEERQAVALEWQASDIKYVKQSQQVRDVLSVASRLLSD